VLETVVGVHVPVIPFVDVVGSVGAAEPEQIGARALNVGVILFVTVTVRVVVVAHWPAFGVNVYVPVAVFETVAGLQVPFIPFVDVVGSVGAADPEQIGAMALNVGVILFVTVTVKVVVVAHWPAFGVNVYVPDAVLETVAGLQVPLIPFVDIVGSVGAADPEQIGAMAVNVGVILFVTVTVIVAVVAHCPAFGVNV